MPIPGSRSVIVKVTRGNLLARTGERSKEQLAWAFGFPSIHGGTVDFAAFKARVLLVANTASFCGPVLSRTIEME